MKNNKQSDDMLIEGYSVGNLTLTIQAVPDSKDKKRLIRGVFGALYVMDADKKEDKINFAMTLDDNKDFKRHIIAMINQAISLKINEGKTPIIKKRTPKTK